MGWFSCSRNSNGEGLLTPAGGHLSLHCEYLVPELFPIGNNCGNYLLPRYYTGSWGGLAHLRWHLFLSFFLFGLADGLVAMIPLDCGAGHLAALGFPSWGAKKMLKPRFLYFSVKNTFQGKGNEEKE